MLKLKQGDQELTLPDERTKPMESLEDYSILLYGEEKIGKTSFAAQFTDSIVLLCEPGGRALSIYSREPKNWKELKGYLKLLQTSKRFRTVVIDTVDMAYQMCYRFICDREGIAHPKEEGFAVAWTMIRDEFQDVMSSFLKLKRGVVFTSHAEEREIKVRTGDSFSRIVPTMSRQARKVIEPMVDMWVYCQHGKTDREFVIRGSDHIAAGHRLELNFVGLSKIPMGRSAKEAYVNFVAGFNNELAVTNKKVKIKIKGR